MREQHRQAKPKRGRPPEYVLPEPIAAPPEKVAEVVLQAKPKKVWRYEQDAASRRRRRAE